MTRLKELLGEKGISQHQLSRGANIPQSSINLIANGKLYPFPGYRKRISRFLQMAEREVFPELHREEDGKSGKS